MVTVAVPIAVAARLKEIARAEDRSVSKVAKRILSHAVGAAPEPQIKFVRRKLAAKGGGK